MILDDAESGVAPDVRETQRLFGLAAIFSITIFLSATLLFSVQPMFTKLILPLLGGASNVWNTAMVFFQAVLLGGYIYAHLVSKYLPLKGQIFVHLSVTAIGLFFLPLAVSPNVVLPESGMPTFWLLGLFGVTVGMPFFALSANAPLLQRWFSLSSHKDARDPYFLYSASNAASLIILCAYPFFIEPNLRLGSQTSSWAIGYGILLGMIGLTAFTLSRRLSTTTPEINDIVTAEKSIHWREKLFWVFLAFLPSSLMLGVTSFMTNNIASAPFLWIIPLALYLLTFVIVFARRPIVSAAGLSRFFPWAVIVGLVLILPKVSFDVLGLTITNSPPAIIKIPLLLGVYFLTSLYCHAILVERRPDVSGLTGFYILMSLGGVIGGIFNALISPVIFNGVYEFILVLTLVLFLRPSGIQMPKAGENPWRLFLIGSVAAVVNAVILTIAGHEIRYVVFITLSILVVASMRLKLPALMKMTALAGLAFAVVSMNVFNSSNIFKDRSFYSLLGVQESDSPHGKIHKFVHGDTFHNFQLRNPDLYDVPTAYYIKGGSIHESVEAARIVSSGSFDIAVIGLGAGAMACYEKADENWVYFEIDPAVVELAKNTKYFNYIDTCAPDADIRIGDARQKLTGIPERSLDMIVVDAFSSDSIPTHLVTREALALYRSRVGEKGLIFFHTSNNYLDVSSVVTRLAEDAGLASRYIYNEAFKNNPYADLGSQSTGVLIGSEEAINLATSGNENFENWIPSDRVKVWTDDYSSVLGTITAHTLKDGKAEAIARR